MKVSVRLLRPNRIGEQVMKELILYSHEQSRGRIVQWMLEELGVPYQFEKIEYGPAMKNADYLSINPMGKIPALKHGDGIVTETAAILTYLADTFSDKGLIPLAESAERAAFYRWIFFIAGPLEQATTATFLNWVTPKTTPTGTPAKGFLGFGSLDLTLDTLENHLKENTYLCGNQFTAADIYLSSHLVFGSQYTKAYETRPVFDDYIKRTQGRPAKKRIDAA